MHTRSCAPTVHGDPEPGVTGLRERPDEHLAVVALALVNDEDRAALVTTPDRLRPVGHLASAVVREHLSAADRPEAKLGPDRDRTHVVRHHLPALVVDLVERDLDDVHRARLRPLREPGQERREIAEMGNLLRRIHGNTCRVPSLMGQSDRRTPPETDLRR